jgi:hypothetical protein
MGWGVWIWWGGGWSWKGSTKGFGVAISVRRDAFKRGRVWNYWYLWPHQSSVAFVCPVHEAIPGYLIGDPFFYLKYFLCILNCIQCSWCPDRDSIRAHPKCNSSSSPLHHPDWSRWVWLEFEPSYFGMKVRLRLPWQRYDVTWTWGNSRLNSKWEWPFWTHAEVRIRNFYLSWNCDHRGQYQLNVIRWRWLKHKCHFLVICDSRSNANWN